VIQTLLRLFAICSLSLICAEGSIAQWVQTDGPHGGRVDCLVVSSRKSGGSILFVGTPAGVYRSADNGTSWVKSVVGPAVTFVSALAADSSNVFAGTSAGVFRSTDEGGSWIFSNAGLPNTSHTVLAVSPGQGRGANLFAGTDSGLYVSTNNGMNWRGLGNGLPKICISAVAFALNASTALTSSPELLVGFITRQTAA
jgi:photosystem II stability/assembly factor-like uncharacterized protein